MSFAHDSIGPLDVSRLAHSLNEIGATEAARLVRALQYEMERLEQKYQDQQAVIDCARSVTRGFLDESEVHPCDAHDDDRRAMNMHAQVRPLYEQLKRLDECAVLWPVPVKIPRS